MSNEKFLKAMAVFCGGMGTILAVAGAEQVRVVALFVMAIVAIVGAMVIESVEEALKGKGLGHD